MIVSSILLAEAVPMCIQIRASQQQQDALMKVRQYGNALGTSGICAITIGCHVSASTAAIAAWPSTFYPTPGSIVVEGYRFAYGLSCGPDGLSCLMATPNTALDGRYSFLVGDDNVVRCNLGQTINATAPVCSF